MLPRHRALILLFLLLNKGIRVQEEELSGATKGAENDQKHHNKNAPFVPVDGIKTSVFPPFRKWVDYMPPTADLRPPLLRRSIG